MHIRESHLSVLYQRPFAWKNKGKEVSKKSE